MPLTANSKWAGSCWCGLIMWGVAGDGSRHAFDVWVQWCSRGAVCSHLNALDSWGLCIACFHLILLLKSGVEVAQHMGSHKVQ